jgi:antitoxin PrlF
MIHQINKLVWSDTMSSSKLTSKYQATIPMKIRKLLHLEAGDSITFHITDPGTVIIKKSQPFDLAYAQALDQMLSEWASEEDEQAYKHLQNL